MERRGALSLSMNTIVVIVIGVTLLSLGLIFVKTAMDRAQGTLTNSFDKADEALDLIDATHSDKLTVPSSITVKRGKDKDFEVYVMNEFDEETQFEIEVMPSENSIFTNEDVKLGFARTKAVIGVDQENRFVANVNTAKNARLDSAAFIITVYANGRQYAQADLFVNIEE